MKATLAQLVEQLIRNEQVAGSSPVSGSIASKFLGAIFFLFLLISCQPKPTDPNETATNEYAQLFSLQQTDSTYRLTCQASQGKPSVLEWKRNTPFERIVCMSGSHLAFLDALDANNTVVGVSGYRYISNPTILQAVEMGKVVDVGYDQSLNYEQILLLKPDLILAYRVSGQDNSALDRLEKLGLPVFVIPDFLEEHPLGKLEYLRLFGALVGKQHRADSIFQARSQAYNELKAQVAGQVSTPKKILINLPYKETWYIPGSHNNFSRLLQDAGAEILGAKPQATDSHPYSFEEVLLLAMQADLWLHPGTANTLASIQQMHRLYAQIPCLQAGKVYNNTRRQTTGGGNDFWEKGVTEPEKILEDLIRILHPGLLPEADFHYYISLQ